MKDAKVVILLATYNGEKYLREQLDSLLRQTYENIKIIIRDDGSKDNTISILEEYIAKDSRISFYTGPNLKAAGCFYDLLCNAEKADYYAFCDQDDVWERDKIEIAVRFLETANEEIPALYLSNLRIVDEELNYLGMRLNEPMKTDYKYYCLTEFLAVGCTQVFNLKAAEFVKKHIPDTNIMHDAWMYMSCMFFGQILYDFDSHILYRQHSNNVVGYRTDKLTILRERVARLFNRQLQPRLTYSIAFLQSYENELSAEEKEQLNKIVHYKDNVRSRVSLLFDKSICSSSFERDLRYRALILWGTI